MSFQQGCYITTVFADGTVEHDQHCYLKHAHAMQEGRRLSGFFPDAKVHVIRARSEEELMRRRAAVLKP